MAKYNIYRDRGYALYKQAMESNSEESITDEEHNLYKKQYEEEKAFEEANKVTKDPKSDKKPVAMGNRLTQGMA